MTGEIEDISAKVAVLLGDLLASRHGSAVLLGRRRV
jgi:hypothetical protein